jgi:hypothetical protein
MKRCGGDGSCLSQMDDGNYQKGYGKICQYECEPLECPNYIICETNFPLWLSYCHHGYCPNCTAIFGCKVNIQNIKPEKCDICYEKITTVAKFPKCAHYVCIPCYRKMYYDLDYSNEEDYEANSIESCPFCRKPIRHDKWWVKVDN